MDKPILDEITGEWVFPDGILRTPFSIGYAAAVGTGFMRIESKDKEKYDGKVTDKDAQ